MELVNRDREIARLRFRIGAVLALRECLRLFFAWLMIWAAVVVGLRAVFRLDPIALLWGLLGLVAAAAAGTLLAVRKMPTASAIRAALDRHGRLGGLLMAAEDADIGQWSKRIERPPMPELRWRLGRQWIMLLAGVGFLAAALLAPDRYLPSDRRTALRIGGEIQKLTEKIELLKQEEVLPPEKAESLEKDLDRTRREALGRDPARTLEAIDHLDHSLSLAAADAAESLIKQTAAVGQAQELAEALHAAEDRIDPKQFGEAMKQLARMSQEAAAESESLAEDLSEELQEALEKGVLTDEQLRELSEALEGCKNCQLGRMARLVRARLVDAEALQLCEKMGECDPEELAELLCLCEDGDELAACLMCGGPLPGRGGINRGRADAAMTWRDGVAKEDAAFKEQVLPPAAVAALKESRLAGISAGAPETAKPGGESSGGALRAAQAGGGEARTQTILPEHKNTVQRYFSREKK
ncbi:MAG: hypothetical protein JW959_12535 [Pirellulales bacterium]|nr:hypothetical protein [Pirellulales bacterium]